MHMLSHTPVLHNHLLNNYASVESELLACIPLWLNVTVTSLYDSYIYCFLTKPAVDPLLLECSSSGTETQITVDCRTNRPPATITCSFDGELEHPCKCVTKGLMTLVLIAHSTEFSILACFDAL